MFSKIIAVAADFDAATNTRSYTAARPADEVLRELWEKPELGHDPVIVKALINLLGIYPIGTVVILDSYELALVHAANSDANPDHRPVVRLLWRRRRRLARSDAAHGPNRETRGRRLHALDHQGHQAR